MCAFFTVAVCEGLEGGIERFCWEGGLWNVREREDVRIAGDILLWLDIGWRDVVEKSGLELKYHV
jgi:hypothetical protein